MARNPNRVTIIDYKVQRSEIANMASLPALVQAAILDTNQIQVSGFQALEAFGNCRVTMSGYWTGDRPNGKFEIESAAWFTSPGPDREWYTWSPCAGVCQRDLADYGKGLTNPRIIRVLEGPRDDQ